MGVWALAQEEKGDAYMFFQISVDKEGVVSGAYKNVLSGEQAPISGPRLTRRHSASPGRLAATTLLSRPDTKPYPRRRQLPCPNSAPTRRRPGYWCG